MIEQEITAALKMADESLARNRWAHLKVNSNEVLLEIGPINTNGGRDRKSATYKFYTDSFGVVHYVTYAHP